MNVCEALIDVLADQGVKHIFGVPGDAINELIEAIRKQDRIKFIHVMHEESGAFAAGAQAKLTGELAVCVGTAGPGAIHLLNGLYDAKMDHAPVLAITGQVETSLMGTSYQQEVDLLKLFSDVASYNQCVINPAQMPEIVTLACQNAIAKCTVSHISIPVDLSVQKVKEYKKKKQFLRNNAQMVPNKAELLHAAELIDKSEKPCILAGIGARNAVNELIELAETIKAPVIKALRGKDLLPDEHPLTLGGIGLLGTKPAYHAIKNCDLLLMIGTDFPYSDFFPENAQTIQLDNAFHRIGRRHPVDLPLVGDTRLTLQELLPLVSGKKNAGFLEENQKLMEEWLKEEDEKELSGEKPIHPQSLARAVSELAARDAIICCDTGEVTVWGARNFRLKEEQRFTLSGHLATMAVGLPAAIGAQVKFPGRQVIALCGDGGFAMLMCDFATAVKYNLPIKVFIFNNSKLGLITIEEEARAGNPDFETGLHNPDYAAFAEACGGTGFTVTEPDQLRSTIAKALDTNKPCIVNVFVDPDELPWPPKVSASEAYHYIKAKITEYFAK
jgi:thiamine pyrophosphate-dependent acetolactate synthase large subunit-like protein